MKFATLLDDANNLEFNNGCGGSVRVMVPYRKHGKLTIVPMDVESIKLEYVGSNKVVSIYLGEPIGDIQETLHAKKL
jgi:hypothetical protein